MKGFPPEVDSLMWAVAEDGKDSAIHEFVGRYPQFRGELMRRVNMVTELRRHSKPVHQELPRFVLRGQKPAVSKKGIAIGGTLCFAALAAAAYTISTFVKQENAIPEVRLPHISKAFLKKAPSQGIPMAVPAIPPENAPSTNSATPAAPDAAEQPVYMRPQARIFMKDANLEMVMQAIAAQGKMKLQIGPGFVDQQVSVDYQDVSPLEALQRMAKEYGFTVLDEGGGQFIALPAVDSGSQAKTSQ
jgi:hypothetical protein